MSGHYFSLFDLAIAGIPALVFGIWQIFSVNREIARDKKAKAESPEGSRHAIGEHRLDDR